MSKRTLPSNITEWLNRAATTEQSNAAKKVQRWLVSLGSGAYGGTSIGKSPQTLILDVKYQGSEIYINCDGDISFHGENVTSKKEFTKIFNENHKSNVA